MNGKKFNSKRAAQAVGLYPHARKVGSFLFLSGVGPRAANQQEIPGVKLNDKGGLSGVDSGDAYNGPFLDIANIARLIGKTGPTYFGCSTSRHRR